MPPLQQLESLAWEHSGKSIVSSHSDGGYMVWAAGGSGQRTQQPVLSTIPYGAWAPWGGTRGARVGVVTAVPSPFCRSLPLQSHQQDPVADLRVGVGAGDAGWVLVVL